MGTSQQKQQMRGDFSNHERLNNYQIVKGKNGKQYMEVSCPIHDTKIITKWQNQIKSFKNKDCLFLPESFELAEEGRCGSSGVIRILFEYYPFSLQKQISNRIGLKSPFNEQELWFLLYQITSSVIQFQNVGKKSGDIRPKNIFINEDGLIKVVNQYSFPDEKSNYMKALEDRESVYLSPEELAEFEKGIVNPRSDPVLGEAFSIGLTILDAGLLIDSEDLYQMKNLRFNLHKFHQSIIRWKQSDYSPFLIRTVENLLEINWFERPTAGQVRAVLEPYQEKIRNLQLFVPSKQKSKAMLDNYQTGSKNLKRTPQSPGIQPVHSPQPFYLQSEIQNRSYFPSIPSSPVSQPINMVKVNNYPQHQIPNNSSIPYVAPISQDLLQRQSIERFNNTEKFQPGKLKVYYSPQSMSRNLGQTHRQVMRPAAQIKIIPNSKAYLQQPEEIKYVSEVPRY